MKTPMFSLVHATRGRPELAMTMHDRWISTARQPDDLEYIFGIDSDDEAMQAVLRDTEHRYVSGPPEGCLAGYNRATVISLGKFIVPVEDDFWPPDGWDDGLREAIAASYWIGQPAAIFIKDLIHDSIAAIYSRDLIACWGSLFPQGYFGQFADTENRDWLDEHPEVLRIDATKLDFEHRHWTNGLAEHDQTYLRKEAYWKADEMLYDQRKAARRVT